MLNNIVAVQDAWRPKVVPRLRKDARRCFYWAVRARVVCSSALAVIAEASPGTTLEYRSRLLESIASIDSTTDLREAAEKLEQLDLTKIVTQLRPQD